MPIQKSPIDLSNKFFSIFFINDYLYDKTLGDFRVRYRKSIVQQFSGEETALLTRGNTVVGLDPLFDGADCLTSSNHHLDIL